MRYSVLIPAVGASLAFVAALDAHLGVGAVELLLELCLSETSANPGGTSLPMKHSANALAFLAAGCALASIAFLSAWRISAARETKKHQCIPDVDINLVAALSMLARASDRYGPEDIRRAYKRAHGHPLNGEVAQASFDLFSLETIEEDLNVFVGISDPHERARIICAALDFSRHAYESDNIFEVIDGIADAMEMDVAEIARAQATFRNNRPVSTVKAKWTHLRAVIEQSSITNTARVYYAAIGAKLRGFPIPATDFKGLSR